MKTLKFFYNGIKAKDGKLQTCYYSDGKLTNHPEGTITIYKRNYERFSQEIRDAFVVENNSDSMTDYFESDKIRVIPSHQLYNDVKAAHLAGKERNAKRFLSIK